jgi:hypothetical protein
MRVESEETVIPAKGVRSLVWSGNSLVDWVSGGVRYELDGTRESARRSIGYRFDAALVSRSGAHVAIYERLGTKGLLVSAADCTLLRELNRSYYFADAYEFPIAFLTLPDGSDGLAHCPRDYCRIDIELAATGRCLTDHPSREPGDIFHSRLQQSPEGAWLASAGWVWHPFDTACLWDLKSILDDPCHLDESRGRLEVGDEVAGLTFMSDGRLVVATGGESAGADEATHRLVVLDPKTGTRLRELPTSGPSGTLLGVDDDLVLSLFDHPKLIRISDGAVVGEWRHLSTGQQNSSIIRHVGRIPPFALHRTERMFAVADDEKITVVRCLTTP